MGNQDTHVIKLRGPWSCKVFSLSDPETPISTTTAKLPLALSEIRDCASDETVRFELERRFSTPTGLTASQQIVIKIVSDLEDMQISLNGALVAERAANNFEFAAGQHLRTDFSKNVLNISVISHTDQGRLEDVHLVLIG